MENTNQNEVTNTQEITCVADFLYVLQNEVKPINKIKKEKQIERFYRGLSKTEYLEIDYPSIYRAPKDKVSEIKKNGKRIIYDPYIKYEHKMFYDLVSRFPEQFSSCKNTFEHLVMMQHYEFPTRLLDVTSNPLVALYFACVNHYGNVNKDEDGAVTIYDIPNKQIRNYNSDTVTILSNLARIDVTYTYFHSYYNQLLKKIRSIVDCEPSTYINLAKEIFDELSKLIELHNCVGNKKGFLGRNQNRRVNILLDKIVQFEDKLNKHEENFDKLFNYDNSETSKTSEEIVNFLKQFVNLWEKWSREYCFKEDIKFKHLIQEEKVYFIHENIKPADLTSVFCVKPKLNNPRIISQNGAFLLFGFADLKKTKIEPPKQHFQFKAAKKGSRGKHKINIIIKGKYKQKIVSELKQLGIHRASLFPEIDKVAQIVLSEYKIKTNSDPKTN